MSLLYKSKAAGQLKALPGGFSISVGKLKIKVLLFNPTNASFTVRSVIGDVYVGGKNIGVVSYFGDLKLAANQRTTLELTVTANAGGLTTTLLSTLTAIINKSYSASSQGVVVKLTCNADNVIINQELNYGG